LGRHRTSEEEKDHVEEAEEDFPLWRGKGKWRISREKKHTVKWADGGNELK